MALTHMIVAMVGTEVVRVRCNTCGSEHKHKSEREVAQQVKPKAERKTTGTTVRSGGTKASAKAPPADANRAARQLFQRAMGERDRATATVYAPSMLPRLGQLVDHKAFGYGIVDAMFDGKTRFLFELGYKILVTGRDSVAS